MERGSGLAWRTTWSKQGLLCLTDYYSDARSSHNKGACNGCAEHGAACGALHTAHLCLALRPRPRPLAPTCVPWPLGWKPHFSNTLALTKSGVMMGVKPRDTTWGRGGGGVNTRIRVHDTVELLITLVKRREGVRTFGARRALSGADGLRLADGG